jgi:hypothetical protein
MLHKMAEACTDPQLRNVLADQIHVAFLRRKYGFCYHDEHRVIASDGEHLVTDDLRDEHRTLVLSTVNTVLS